MRVVGIDYASTGLGALALAVDGIPKSTTIYDPKKHDRRKESDVRSIANYEKWLVFKLGMWKPDIISVEHLAVFQNAKTIRALSHRESIALLVASKTARIVVHYPVSQARSVVFGNGAMGKDECWEKRAKHIDFTFSRKKTVGGMDEMDAMTQALAAPVLMERR